MLLLAPLMLCTGLSQGTDLACRLFITLDGAERAASAEGAGQAAPVVAAARQAASIESAGPAASVEAAAECPAPAHAAERAASVAGESAHEERRTASWCAFMSSL